MKDWVLISVMLVCFIGVAVGCPMLSYTLSYDECLMVHPKSTCETLLSNRRKLLGSTTGKHACAHVPRDVRRDFRGSGACMVHVSCVCVAVIYAARVAVPCTGNDHELLLATNAENAKEQMAKMDGGMTGACASCLQKYGSDPKAVGRECAGMKETGPPPLVDSNGVLTPEIVCNTSATNCIPNTGGMLNKIFGGYSWIDIISSWAAGLLPSQPVPDHLKGKDMCMWNYQSLPPPPGPTKGVPYARQRLALGLQAVHSCH